MFLFGTNWKTRYSLVSEQMCTINYKMDWSLWHTTISFDLLHPSHMWLQTIFVWETLPNHADWDCFKTPILREILRTQNLRQVELCSFSEVMRLFQSVGCVRNKLQFRTVQQNQKSFPWTLDWGWTKTRTWFMGSDRHSSSRKHGSEKSRTGRPCTNLVRAAPHKLQMRKKSHEMIDDLENVDFIPWNVHSSRQEALLYIFEDNEAMIKMIIKGRSLTMRHVSRTHRVALDRLFHRINLDPKIQTRRHQKPARRHTDQWKFHTWWMESSFVFV